MTEQQQRFASVWDAIEDTPAEAENMKLRSSLMRAITEQAAAWPGIDTEKARRLGITGPRFSNLKLGKINAFSLDALVAIAVAAGLSVELSITGHAA
ncbi:helix-turn-helix domain-containing protein [Azomonas macrocytogenes]|uniref:Putative XRE-type DNA-binding protein n=1 Tax=Azomonas macrocytogenes TaxID=69962 RepID=A0A839TAJ6_AZOMA|nr:XRE family transcriptional regulator [Azomonas macrocytogenes]MBB3105174.1 putative XRE-type DNA-binding protein [Azomonas macrocytogenes]